MTLAAAELYPGFVAELEAATRARRPATSASGALHVALDRDEAEELRRVHDLQRALGLDAEWLPPRALPRARAGPDPVLHRRRPRAGRGRGRPPRADRGAARRRSSGGRRGARPGRGRPRPCSTASGSPASGPRAGEELRAPTPSSSPAAPGRAPRAGCPRPPARRCARSRARSSSCARRDGASRRCERIVASERVYLVPRPDGRLIVGATVEERGFDTAVTAGGVHELLREAYRAAPRRRRDGAGRGDGRACAPARPTTCR